MAKQFVMGALALILLAASGALAQSVSLTVEQPSTPFTTTKTVTVSWSFTSGSYQEGSDYVSVWWEPFAGTYTEFYNVTSSFGSTQFNLLNARHSYLFKYYRGSQLLATADQVITTEGSYPMQIKVSHVPQHPDRAQIIWTTNRTNGDEIVYFGTSPSTLSNSQTAQTSRTYTQADLYTITGIGPIEPVNEPFADLGCRCLRCHGDCYNDTTASYLFVDPGHFHVAEVSGLQAGTKYYFTVGEASGWQSDVIHFKSRKAASASASIQILYTADAGVGYAYGSYAGSASHNSIPLKYGDAEGGRHVWDAIKADPATAQDDVSIMNGDISYARGWPWVWELMAMETQSLWTNAPVMATYGNHEFDYNLNPFKPAQNGGSGGEAGVVTGVRFNFASQTKPWYQMTQGPIHFFALSSEHSVQEQAQWLQQELPNVDRSVTPFLIIMFHRPVHASSPDIAYDILQLMEQYYTDLFSSYGVDMVLSGHLHYYERTCAISNGECANFGFRPLWSAYENTVMASNDCTTRITKDWKISDRSCKITCMYTEGCNGAYTESDGSCNIVKCPHPLPSSPGTGTLYSLKKSSGNPPVYIVDGTAGGSHVPSSSPTSKITEYKDFSQWGYSRISATGTSLTWNHYHIDGNLVDTVTLQAVNTAGNNPSNNLLNVTKKN